MQQPFWSSVRVGIVGGTVLYLAFWLGLGFWSPLRGEVHFWLLLPILLGLICFVAGLGLRTSTASRLRHFLGLMRSYKFFDETYASYRYVDLCRALERLGAASAGAESIERSHPRHTLQTLLRDYSLVAVAAPQTRLCVGYKQHTFVPAEVYWCLLGPPGLAPTDRAVVRLSTPAAGAARLEIAARSVE